MDRRWRSFRERRLRLPGYDYAQPGAYFVTMLTLHRRMLFGRVVVGRVVLSPLGRIVDRAWSSIADVRPAVSLGARVVMPNHVHGIVIIRDVEGVKLPSLSTIIGGFKGEVTRASGSAPGEIWQQRFHERVVRSLEELEAMEAYILQNPLRWQRDRENPESMVEWEARDGEWSMNPINLD